MKAITKRKREKLYSAIEDYTKKDIEQIRWLVVYMGDYIYLRDTTTLFQDDMIIQSSACCKETKMLIKNFMKKYHLKTKDLRFFLYKEIKYFL